MSHEEYINEAIKMAEYALLHDDIPVGAVVVLNGKIIGRGENRREVDSDPLAHAEIVALKDAAKSVGNWNLSGASLYVTLEPCAMCAGTIINSRIERLYFGAFDGKYGCCGSIYNLPEDRNFNHHVKVTGGILNEKCKNILTEYFKKKRISYKLF
ncbi:MAG: nucleoside deaminase [Clostridia bacterium]|nr:nucleoside deaminase [Clostridia bacterium]